MNRKEVREFGLLLGKISALAFRIWGGDGREDDIVITCDLCNDQQFWMDNFGDDWQTARAVFCGRGGLNCSGF